MADRTVGGLPLAADLYDDSLLVVEQQGAAHSLTGARLKRYARAGVEDYVEDALRAAKTAQAAQTAAASSAEQAQAAREGAEEAQAGAAAARKAVEDLEVSVDTLPAGTPASVEKTAKEGHVLLKLGLPTGARGPQGLPGSSILKIERTAGTGAAGTVDTYTVTLTDGSTSSFQVRNGADGQGSGDMLAAVYDPQGKTQDVFAYAEGLLPVVHALTLAADGWAGESAPFTQVLPVPGVVAEEAAQVIHIQPQNLVLWAASGLACTGQGDGVLTFTAQEKPGADIPLHAAVQTARKGGTAV